MEKKKTSPVKGVSAECRSVDSDPLNSLVRRILESSLPYEEEYFVRV